MKNIHSPFRYGFTLGEARLLAFAASGGETPEKKLESSDLPKSGEATEGKTAEELKTDLRKEIQDLTDKITEAGADSAAGKKASVELRKVLDTIGRGVEAVDMELAAIVEKAEEAIGRSAEKEFVRLDAPKDDDLTVVELNTKYPKLNEMFMALLTPGQKAGIGQITAEFVLVDGKPFVKTTITPLVAYGTENIVKDHQVLFRDKDVDMETLKTKFKTHIDLVTKDWGLPERKEEEKKAALKTAKDKLDALEKTIKTLPEIEKNLLELGRLALFDTYTRAEKGEIDAEAIKTLLKNIDVLAKKVQNMIDKKKELDNEKMAKQVTKGMDGLKAVYLKIKSANVTLTEIQEQGYTLQMSNGEGALKSIEKNEPGAAANVETFINNAQNLTKEFETLLKKAEAEKKEEEKKAELTKKVTDSTEALKAVYNKLKAAKVPLTPEQEAAYVFRLSFTEGVLESIKKNEAGAPANVDTYVKLTGEVTKALETVLKKAEAEKKESLDALMAARKKIEDAWHAAYPDATNAPMKTVNIYTILKEQCDEMIMEAAKKDADVKVKSEALVKKIDEFVKGLPKPEGKEAKEETPKELLAKIEKAEKSLIDAWKKAYPDIKMAPLKIQEKYQSLLIECGFLRVDIAFKKENLNVRIDKVVKNINEFVDLLQKQKAKEQKELADSIGDANKKLNDAWKIFTEKSTPGRKLLEEHDGLQSRFGKFVQAMLTGVPLVEAEVDSFITDTDACIRKLTGGLEKDAEKAKLIKRVTDVTAKAKAAWDAAPDAKKTEGFTIEWKSTIEKDYIAVINMINAGTAGYQKEGERYCALVEILIKVLERPKEENDTEKAQRECRERMEKAASNLERFALQSDRDNRIAAKLRLDIDAKLKTAVGKDLAETNKIIQEADKLINDANLMYEKEKGWEQKKKEGMAAMPENEWKVLPEGKPGFIHKKVTEGGNAVLYAYCPAIGPSSIQKMDGSTLQWSLITDSVESEKVLKNMPADAQKKVEEREVERLKMLYTAAALTSAIQASLPAAKVENIMHKAADNTVVMRCTVNEISVSVPFYLPGHPNGDAVEYPSVEEIGERLAYLAKNGKPMLSNEQAKQLAYLRRSEGLMQAASGARPLFRFGLDGRKPYLSADEGRLMRRWIDTSTPVWRIVEKKAEVKEMDQKEKEGKEGKESDKTKEDLKKQMEEKTQKMSEGVIPLREFTMSIMEGGKRKLHPTYVTYRKEIEDALAQIKTERAFRADNGYTDNTRGNLIEGWQILIQKKLDKISLVPELLAKMDEVDACVKKDGPWNEPERRAGLKLIAEELILIERSTIGGETRKSELKEWQKNLTDGKTPNGDRPGEPRRAKGPLGRERDPVKAAALLKKMQEERAEALKNPIARDLNEIWKLAQKSAVIMPEPDSKKIKELLVSINAEVDKIKPFNFETFWKDTLMKSNPRMSRIITFTNETDFNIRFEGGKFIWDKINPKMDKYRDGTNIGRTRNFDTSSSWKEDGTSHKAALKTYLTGAAGTEKSSGVSLITTADANVPYAFESIVDGVKQTWGINCIDYKKSLLGGESEQIHLVRMVEGKPDYLQAVTTTDPPTIFQRSGDKIALAPGWGDTIKNYMLNADLEQTFEDADGAGMRTFDFPKDKEIAHFSFVQDLVKIPDGAVGQLKDAAKGLNSVLKDAGYKVNPLETVLITDADPSATMKKAFAPKYDSGCRDFIVSILAHGDGGFSFKTDAGRVDLTYRQIMTVFRGFKGARFTLETIACHGGGNGVDFAEELKDNPDEEEGRVTVMTQTKPYAYHHTGDATTFYKHLQHYIAQGLPVGQAYLEADRQNRMYWGFNPEVRRSSKTAPTWTAKSETEKDPFERDPRGGTPT